MKGLRLTAPSSNSCHFAHVQTHTHRLAYKLSEMDVAKKDFCCLVFLSCSQGFLLSLCECVYVIREKALCRVSKSSRIFVANFLVFSTKQWESCIQKIFFQNNKSRITPTRENYSPKPTHPSTSASVIIVNSIEIARELTDTSSR